MPRKISIKFQKQLKQKQKKVFFGMCSSLLTKDKKSLKRLFVEGEKMGRPHWVRKLSYEEKCVLVLSRKKAQLDKELRRLTNPMEFFYYYY